jgi:pilus assembly protein FimV
MTQVAEEVAHDAEQDISQTASDLDMLHTPEGDIDPIVEADVYLAYRRYQQAESLIQNALAKQPDRQDLQAKLLEIYYASKNADSFQSVAEALYVNLGSNPDNELWQRVLPMGRELCPDHALFSSSADVGEEVDKGAMFDEVSTSIGDAVSGGMESGLADETGAATEESFDLNLGGESADVGLSEDAEKLAEAPQEEKMDFDLNLGEASAGESTIVTPEEPAEETPESLSAALGFANQSPAEEDQERGGTAEAAGESEAEPKEQGNSWEIEPAISDFGNIDFGLDDADLLAGTDVVGTKLDLARAYIDMGDNDSARDILTEVIEEGNDLQKQEAKGLVEKIA